MKKIHLTRIMVTTTIFLFTLAALAQIRPVPAEPKLGTPALQKIIEVREMRDSLDKKQDSLIIKLDKAIAVKNRKDLVKKNK
jgi:hypothetical protein